MTHKQRVTTVLRHERPDKVPYHVGFTVPARQKMAEFYGDADFASKIGNHLAVVPVIRVEWGVRGPDGYYTDEFGLRWNRQVDADIGMPEGNLTREKLNDFHWPDPDAPNRFDRLAETVERQSDQFVVMALDFSLFERAWGLVGLERFLLAMIEDLPFVEALLDRILAFNLDVLDAGLRRCPDVDAVYFGDDFGSQLGVMMGAGRWRELLMPRLARQYARVRDHGKFVFIHSCGKVGELFDDLVNIGVSCFNPFQPEVIDIYETKEKYRGRLAFWGGISTQQLLPYGTPGEVRAEVERILEKVGREGGYIAAPAHDTPGDVPAENIAAMLDVLQSQ
ncbi:MAG: hypothetical protein JXQ73_29255 [Phycisphaerae bacterium]|nr:hypothetical protein [Phycisphaerae bacterium]